MKKSVLLFFTLFIAFSLHAQNKSLTTGKYGDGTDSIAPVGIIKNLTDDQLLEVVQKQTFRFFWHGAHPASTIAMIKLLLSCTLVLKYFYSAM